MGGLSAAASGFRRLAIGCSNCDQITLLPGGADDGDEEAEAILQAWVRTSSEDWTCPTRGEGRVYWSVVERP
jgi:hypothetical protein